MIWGENASINNATFSIAIINATLRIKTLSISSIQYKTLNAVLTC